MEWKKGALQRVCLGCKGESYSVPASYSNEETRYLLSEVIFQEKLGIWVFILTTQIPQVSDKSKHTYGAHQPVDFAGSFPLF